MSLSTPTRVQAPPLVRYWLRGCSIIAQKAVDRESPTGSPERLVGPYTMGDRHLHETLKGMYGEHCEFRVVLY